MLRALGQHHHHPLTNHRTPSRPAIPFGTRYFTPPARVLLGVMSFSSPEELRLLDICCVWPCACRVSKCQQTECSTLVEHHASPFSGAGECKA